MSISQRKLHGIGKISAQDQERHIVQYSIARRKSQFKTKYAGWRKVVLGLNASW